MVSAGSLLAGPFAAQLMAEWGADVLWVENPKLPDMIRVGSGGFWVEAERRNQRNIALDIQSDQGRDIFLSLIASAEILVESSKGGHFARLGLSDQVLWDANPGLVIAHVSGFGQSGVQEVLERTCYDPIAQAFGCYMQLNRGKGGAPQPAKPIPGDYFTGLMAASATLAALVRARETGEGDSIDVAMFEVLARVSTLSVMDYFNRGIKPTPGSAGEMVIVGMGTYRCADGVDVYLVLSGAGVVKRALELLGMADSLVFARDLYYVEEGSAGAPLLQQALLNFCGARTAELVETQMARVGVPCSRILTYDVAENEPHYNARGVFASWPNSRGKPIKGVKVVPEFARRPGRVWRGASGVGWDNEAILSAAGLGEEQISDLYRSKIIFKSDEG